MDTKKKRITLREVKHAESLYASALTRYGENNLATIRAEITYRSIRDAYAAQKRTTSSDRQNTSS